MDSLLAVARHSLSCTRRSLRNHTMAARRRAAPLEGSEGRRGLRERGFWRGMAEKEDFFEERLGGEIIKGERERAEGMWRGILTDFGESSWVVFVGVKKWVGRTEEREREMDAAGGGLVCCLTPQHPRSHTERGRERGPTGLPGTIGVAARDCWR